MAKPETLFRRNKVDPMLRKLPNCVSFSIQQKSIIGDPDKMLCLLGKFVALEIKTDEGKVSPLQLIKLKQVQKAGGVALVIRPNNFKEIEVILMKIATGEKYEPTSNSDDISGAL